MLSSPNFLRILIVESSGPIKIFWLLCSCIRKNWLIVSKQAKVGVAQNSSIRAKFSYFPPPLRCCLRLASRDVKVNTNQIAFEDFFGPVDIYP